MMEVAIEVLSHLREAFALRQEGDADRRSLRCGDAQPLRPQDGGCPLRPCLSIFRCHTLTWCVIKEDEVLARFQIYPERMKRFFNV